MVLNPMALIVGFPRNNTLTHTIKTAMWVVYGSMINPYNELNHL